MPHHPNFRAELPKRIVPGNEIFIRGTLSPNPNKISFNFIVGHDPNNVAMHFKTQFQNAIPGYEVVFNHKYNGEWEDECRYPKDWHVDGSNTFSFVFRFESHRFQIYSGNENGESNSFLYDYAAHFPMESITRFEIWDDQATVDQLTFRYKTI